MSNSKYDQATERNSSSATKLEETSVTNNTLDEQYTDNMPDSWLIPRPDSKTTIFVRDKRGNNIITPIQEILMAGFDFRKQEKFQMTSPFKGVDLVFLGENPLIINMNLVVINADNKNWRDRWIYYWNNYLRGSTSVFKGYRTIITADNLIAEGVFTEYRYRQSGDNNASGAVAVQFVCPPGNLAPIKYFEKINFGPNQTDDIRGDVLATLKSGNGNSYFANKDGEKKVLLEDK